jgi:glycine C-acetyltransferase
MSQALLKRLDDRLEESRNTGALKRFRTLESPIGARVFITGHGEVLLFASNDYLGLANHPEVTEAGQDAICRYGAGTASARFICGTFAPHLALERALADFLGRPDAVTFSSCWAANTALIPVICQDGDVILSDELNHASLIDGCRMAGKETRRFVYPHSDMAALAALLEEHREAPARFIITDGVFSMEGDLAKLDEIVSLARRFDAIVIADDAHGIGTVGSTGGGVVEHYDVRASVDIITGSLGKALGGAAGGFVAGPTAVVESLKQFGRPHLFSNALPVSVASSTHKALDILANAPEMVKELSNKASYFRQIMGEAGISPIEGSTPIVPVVIGDTSKAMAVSEMLLDKGVFVTGLGYPVVPEGTARLRFQVSLSHSSEQLNTAVTCLQEVLDTL